MSDQDEFTAMDSMPAVAGGSAVPVRATRRALPKTFAAFRHRNYRLYFFGHFVALTGLWMQNVAQSWLVYQLTGSPLYLGIVSFASSIPILAFSLGAGVLVDRVPIRWLLLRTQTAAKALAFILAADVFFGWVQPWHIVILAFLLGIVNTFDAPARQSFVIEMVGREDLTNAIALNSANFNSARIFGPTIAGILLALVGPAWCFLEWTQLDPHRHCADDDAAAGQGRGGRKIFAHSPSA
jgi:MFS family permease